MSIMVPSPTTAPMLMMAPIMMTALSPMETFSRMMAPGSMRAFTPRTSSIGTPELRRSHSTTTSSMSSALSLRAGPTCDQSPKTTLLPVPKTWESEP